MRALDLDKALVLLSGGQDSATCLAWTLARARQVETVGFTYGQRHAVEMEARLRVRARLSEAFPDWGAKLGPDHLIDLKALSEIGETAMTADVEITTGADGLPTTFVPGRNLAFLVLAGALAYRRSARRLVGGMCETDYSGYPDCRDAALQAQADALRLGMDADFQLETPLMRLDKAATWRLAEELGGAALVEIIRVESHTCYKGERGRLHEWGYGCGVCPACELRARGWAAYVSGSQA